VNAIAKNLISHALYSSILYDNCKYKFDYNYEPVQNDYYIIVSYSDRKESNDNRYMDVFSQQGIRELDTVNIFDMGTIKKTMVNGDY
jgi:hypothetical protein